MWTGSSAHSAGLCYSSRLLLSVLLFSLLSSIVHATGRDSQYYADNDKVPLDFRPLGSAYSGLRFSEYGQMSFCKPETMEQRKLSLGNLIYDEYVEASAFNVLHCLT